MESVISYNTFNTFKPTSKKAKSLTAGKFQRGQFDQILPAALSANTKTSSDYTLDSLSDIISNQSLTQDQIVRSQTKTIDEKFTSLTPQYEIPKIEEVKNFLSKSQFLFPLLEEIPNKIHQYFGNNQRLSLKVSFEPDFPQSSELWVSILTELPAKEAFLILEKFDEEWWLESMDRADCKLNIILKFV